MGLSFNYIEGQTPIDEDEKEELRLTTISTRGELDEFEQQNIEQAILWTKKKKFAVDEILTETFVKELHRQMLGNVWKWAGEFRKTNKNLGVDKHQISIGLRMLLENSKYWIENDSYKPEEIAIRFKHLLVSIHCFANGNGRHSRLMADVLIQHVFDLPVFTWGSKNLADIGDLRKVYITSLKEADTGNIEPLLRFSRT